MYVCVYISVFKLHIFLKKNFTKHNVSRLMLAIAGKKVGPNWLKLFEETYGYPGGNIGYTIFYFCCCQKSKTFIFYIFCI